MIPLLVNLCAILHRCRMYNISGTITSLGTTLYMNRPPYEMGQCFINLVAILFTRMDTFSETYCNLGREYLFLFCAYLYFIIICLNSCIIDLVIFAFQVLLMLSVFLTKGFEVDLFGLAKINYSRFVAYIPQSNYVVLRPVHTTMLHVSEAIGDIKILSKFGSGFWVLPYSKIRVVVAPRHDWRIIVHPRAWPIIKVPCLVVSPQMRILLQAKSYTFRLELSMLYLERFKSYIFWYLCDHRSQGYRSFGKMMEEYFLETYEYGEHMLPPIVMASCQMYEDQIEREELENAIVSVNRFDTHSPNAPCKMSYLMDAIDFIAYQEMKFETESGSKHAQLFEDFIDPGNDYRTSKGKDKVDKCVKKTKQQVVFLNKTGRVFESRNFEGKRLLRDIANLTYDKIPGLIGSLVGYYSNFDKRKKVRYGIKPTGQGELEEQKEFSRRLNAVRYDWNITEQGDLNMKRLIADLYAENSAVIKTVAEFNVVNIEHYQFIQDHQIFMTPFAAQHFKPVGQKEPLLSFGELGPIYELVSQADRTSKQLTPKKIRSMLKSLLYENKEEKVILDVFRNKCYLWPAKQGLFPKQEKSETDEAYSFRVRAVCQKLSWLVPYVPPSLMRIVTTDMKKFSEVFRDLVAGVREKIIEFARQYVTFSLLTHAERKRVLTHQKKLFSSLLQTAEIQKQFLRQESDYVKEQVYKQNVDFLHRERQNHDQMTTVLDKKRDSRDINRLKARDQKREQQVMYLDIESKQYDCFNKLTPGCEYLCFDSKRLWHDCDPHEDSLIFQIVDGIFYFTFIIAFFAAVSIVASRFFRHHGFTLLIAQIVAFFQGARRLLARRRAIRMVQGLPRVTPNVLVGESKKGDDFSYLQFCQEYFWSTRFGVQIGNIHKLIRTVIWVGETKESCEEMMERWWLMFQNPKKYSMTEKEKNYLVLIKALLHTVYYAYNGAYGVASSHLSYLACIFPEKGLQMLHNAYHWVKPIEEDDGYVNYSHKGQVYRMNNADYQHLRDIAENDPTPLYSVDEFLRTRLIRDQVEAESLTEFSTFFAKILTSFRSDKMTDQELRRVNAQFTLMSNVSRYTSEKLNFISKVVSYLSRYYFNIDPLDERYQRYTLQVLDWVRDTDIIMSFEESQLHNPVFIDRVLRCYNTGIRLRENPDAFHLTKELTYRFEHQFTKVESQARKCMQFRVGAKKRLTPTCSLFRGKPGSGKTSAIEKICDFLVKLEHRDDPKVSDIFQPHMRYIFNGNDEYWEGYTPWNGESGAFVTEVDDIFQTDDKEIRRMEALAQIGMVNTAPYNLEMARLENKGGIFFDSPYVFLSTNFGDNVEQFDTIQWPIGLTQPEAFKRRLHLVFRRDERCRENTLDNEFLVEKCLAFPQWVGKKLNTKQIAHLIHQSRKKMAEQEQSYEVSSEEMYHHLENSYVDFSLQPEMMPLPREKPISPEDSERIVMSMLELKIYSWWNSPDRNFYIAITALIAALFCTAFIWKFFFPEEDPNELVGESKPRKEKSGRERREIKRSRRLQRVFETESKKEGPCPYPKHELSLNPESAENNYYAALYSVGKCICVLMTEDVEPIRRGLKPECETSVCTHLKDGIFLCTAHHFMKYSERPETVWKIMFHNKEVVVFSKPEEFIQITNDDLVVFRMPAKVNLPPGILKYAIPDELRYPIPMSHPMQLLTVGREGGMCIKEVNRANMPENMIYRTNDIYNEQIIIKEKISYYGRSEQGDSGSPLFIMGNQGKPLFIGVHILGQTRKVGMMKYSVASPISLEWLTPIVDEFYALQPESLIVETFPLVVDRIVPEKEVSHSPNRSKLRHSPLWGYNGLPVCIPARLHPFKNPDGEIIDPMKLALGKLHQERTPPCDGLDGIKDYLHYEYPSLGDSFLLTYDQAINGIEGTNITSICIGTSAGYPFCLKSNKGKEPYVYADNQRFYYHPDFLIHVQEQNEKLRRGEQISVIYKDQLKDELRPVAKVMAGKTRLFSTSPVDFLILGRIYFGNFISYIQSRAATHPIAVGIDAHSIHWTMLRDRLSKTDKSVIAGDFSNWDGLMPAFMVDIVTEYINEWYDDGETNAHVRKLLMEHITQPYRINGKFIYQTQDGNTSGNFFTTILNSLVNMSQNYVVLTRDLGLTINEFNQVVYGDDNIITIAREGIKCSTLAPHLKRRFNMVYTHFSKEEVDVHDTLQTIAFLGRKFVRNGVVYQAPLELTTIIEMPYWYRGDVLPEEALLATCMSFFQELSHHSEEVYKRYSVILLIAVKRRIPDLYDAIQKMNRPYEDFFAERYLTRREPPITNFTEPVDEL